MGLRGKGPDLTMRVVLTGSSGRIGQAIHARLSAATEIAQDGVTIIGIDQVTGPVTTQVADLTALDSSQWQAVLRGADAVIHVAALHAPHVGQVPDARFVSVNVNATARLLEAAAAISVSRIVFTSTTALYGAAHIGQQRAAWINEATVPQPQSIYHRTKLQAEACLQQAAEQGGPQVRILRMSRCFAEPLPIMAGYRLHRGIDARDVADAHACALTDADPARWSCHVVSAPTPFEPEDCEALWSDAAAVIRHRAPNVADACAARGWALPASIDRVYDPSLAQRTWHWRARFDALAFMVENE